MEYTIISRRIDKYKLILFVDKLSHSTLFGFKVDPKSNFCKGYIPSSPKVPVDKKDLKQAIQGYKHEWKRVFKHLWTHAE